MHKNKTKEIVYFQSHFSDENFNRRGLSIALYFWNKFPAKLGNEIYIKGALDHYDNFRLLCLVYTGKKSILTSFEKYDELFLDLTCFQESEDNEFSLQIIPKSKLFHDKKSIKILAENINEILHADERFFDVRWFNIDEVGKAEGTDNPS